MLKKEIIIISNTDSPIYYNGSDFKYHEELIEDFILKNHFPADTEKYDLFDLGYIILSIAYDMVVCEIPKKISDNQFAKLLEIRPYIERYHKFIGEIENNDMLEIAHPPQDYNGSLIDYFYEQVEEKCLERTKNRW